VNGKTIAAGVAGIFALGLVIKGALEGRKGASSSGQPTTPERQALLDQADLLLGVPYQWGGGRSTSDYGVDCSGLIILASKRAGLPLPPCPLATSNGWWKCLPRVSSPEPGDLALYGNASEDRAFHVELVRSWDGEVAQTIGANGGDRDVLTPEIAEERGAFVRYASTEGRSNFLGFVRNPLGGTPGESVPVNIHELQADEA